MKKFIQERKIATGVIVVLVLAGGTALQRTVFARGTSVPTAEVKRGEFVEYLQIRGEIKARNSKIMTAPSSSGDLQLLKLVKTGTQVKKDDVIIQFDTTTLQRTLQQKQTELKSAEAEIQRQRAEGHMAEEQTLTDSLSAKYNVERAKLDASKQEILSEIDGAKTKLTLGDTQQKLLESEEKVKSGHTSVDADVEMKKRKREKALFDVQLAEKQIASMTIKAPSDGMVTLLPNFRASMFGSNPPDFKEGDRAWPGAGVAELPDLSEIRFEARIEEADRGQLKIGQPAVVRVEALPDKEFTAKIRDISTLAKLDFSGWPPAKNFSINIEIESTDARIRPGMSANSRVAINRIADSILVPNESVFRKNGRSVVYVQHGGSFEEREVLTGRRNATSVQVAKGLQAGEKVALQDPTDVTQKK